MTRHALDGPSAESARTAPTSRRTAGAARAKTAIAAVIALAGVGAAVYSINSLTSRPERRGRIVINPGPTGPGGPNAMAPAPGDAPTSTDGVPVPGGGRMVTNGAGPRIMGIPAHMQPTPAEKYDFPRVRETADVTRLLNGLLTDLGSRINADTSFGWMNAAQREKLRDAVRLAVEPAALGTETDFANALATLGGRDQGDPKPSSRLFERLSPALAMSSLDLSNLRVTQVDTSQTSPMPRRAGVSVLAMRMAGANENDSRLTILSIATDDLFPEVADYMGSKKRAVEVRVPVRTKGSDAPAGDLDLSLVMVWNNAAQAWQPADYRMFVRNADVGRRLMPERGTAGPAPDPSGK